MAGAGEAAVVVSGERAEQRNALEPCQVGQRMLVDHCVMVGAGMGGFQPVFGAGGVVIKSS